jgi:hypothetical protein
VKPSAVIPRGRLVPAPEVAESNSLQNDPRLTLAQRVAAGPHFARSALLSKFLLYVVSETLAGRQEAITEHRIGVAVFGRPVSYRTDDDNIVRNYARQLRRRLGEHFDGIGRSEPMRIDVPVGGYIPLFVDVAAETERNSEAEEKPERSRPILVAQTDERPMAASAPLGDGALTGFMRAVLVLIGILLVASLGWQAKNLFARRELHPNPDRLLWKAIFGGPRNTLIVPSDAGFNLVEDMSHQSFPLSSYIKESFTDSVAKSSSEQALRDLRSQQYTDVVSMQIAMAAARLPEFDPQRIFVRFPRDLQITDLKSDNALIIGSMNANPWAGLIDAKANFHIVSDRDMKGAQIVNTRPIAGEAQAYTSHWNETAHETYALILFLPNLSGSGHVLVVEGLDVAGTQAAAELLFYSSAIAPVLKAAERSDGTLRPFEILVRATSIQSNATGTQIIASRIH